MFNSRFFLILSGPTAVGKTAAVSLFAKKFPVEVINADVGQFYEPLSIGTAKPFWQNEEVPHHCFDLFKEPTHFSVVSYRQKVMALMEEIWARQHVPLLVGGSLFYLRSLFFPPQLREGPQQEERITTAHSSCSPRADKATRELWQALAHIDLERAQKIAMTDRYRIMRALELWEKTGIKPTLHRPLFVAPPAPYVFIFLTREREELYQRINNRVLEMMELGWINEVRGLPPCWRIFLQEKRFIGYPEIDEYLLTLKEEGSVADDDLLIKVQTKTRNYAKRQITFWRMLQRDLIEQKNGKIDEINLTLSDLALYIEHVFSCVQSFFANSGGESNEWSR